VHGGQGGSAMRWRNIDAARQLTIGRAGQVFIDGPVDDLSRDPEGSRPVGRNVIRTR